MKYFIQFMYLSLLVFAAYYGIYKGDYSHGSFTLIIALGIRLTNSKHFE